MDLKVQYKAIKAEMDTAIQAVIDTTAFIGGKAVVDFEVQFAQYIGTGHCIGVANGTDALTIALKALGIGPGDEVITAANSFVATSEAITAAGARVVFVDCRPDYYTINCDLIEKAITSKTKAIIPVHLFGQPADMDRISEIAGKHKLAIIEDCAQAHGAAYKGKRVGTFGEAGCYSFYPGKNLGAYGDAGAIVTDNSDLAKKCRMLANHGRIEKYNHEFEGYNSRLDGLQAAVLSVKLRHLEVWTKQRIDLARRYNGLLAGVPRVVVPQELPETRCVYHLYVIRADQRDQLQAFLKEHDISTGIHYPTGLPYLKAYQYLESQPADFPVTYEYQNTILSLPFFPEMDQAMTGYVVDRIKQFYRERVY